MLLFGNALDKSAEEYKRLKELLEKAEQANDTEKIEKYKKEEKLKELKKNENNIGFYKEQAIQTVVDLSYMECIRTLTYINS